jgi:Transposase DDE domain
VNQGKYVFAQVMDHLPLTTFHRCVARRHSRKVDRSTGLVCDQTVTLTVFYTQQGYPTPLRRVHFADPETGKRLVFLSNNFTVPALTITQLDRQRWQIELFFKWIKQHPCIKAFFGESQNASWRSTLSA